jgi:hypothetical protein
MPKHFIYPRPLPDGRDAQSRLELHWQAGSYVQIGSATWAGDPNHVDSTLVYLQPATGIVVPDPKEAWPGQFVELDRDQVNHLIRELRMARNQAFGKDE